MIPAWRQAPPIRIFVRRASSTNAAEPHRTEPIGAPSPLDRQNMSASTSPAYSATGVPLAALALKIRAPSRYRGTFASSATLRIARRSSIGTTLPPPTWCVFSTSSRSTTSTP